MSTERKMAIRKDFTVIFNDIQDSVLRTLYDMPRPLLMILRLVKEFVSSIANLFVMMRSMTICQEDKIFFSRKISSIICGNLNNAIVTFSFGNGFISTETN